MTPDQRLKFAELVSTVLGPVPMGVLLGLAVGIHSGRGLIAGAGWGLLSVACAAVLPAATTRPLRKRQPRTRNIRLAYMGSAVVGAGVGACLLWLLPAPPDVQTLAVGFAAGLVLSSVVNVFSASSNHVAALAGGLTLGATLLSPWVLLAGGAVGLLGWSRVATSTHTAAQAVTGAAIGLISSALVVLTLTS